MFASNPARHLRLAGSPATLYSVEQSMRDAAGLSATDASIVQQAIAHHLDSGGGRTRARIATETGNALMLRAEDTIAIAAASELLHNASLIHDDLQDDSSSRRGTEAVWSKFGTNVAICAGDLLVSAAYGILASCSEGSRVAELNAVMHEATTRVIKGQAEDLAAQSKGIDSISSYNLIARGKSGPLLSLPVELALTMAEFPDYIAVAREAAEQLAIAYQIADDLEDEHADARAAGRGCLNAVIVLRGGGSADPREAARTQAAQALREAMRYSLYLPNESGEPLLRCTEAVRAKLRSSI
ncbi:MAG: polyprenyl synthetase family protein [Woeseiaceae bacterium]